MKVLNIVESAYRGTLEEQDDTVIWITHAMKGAGAELNVLLRGNAVNYVVKAQRVPPLCFGDREQKQAPHIAKEVGGLIAKGVDVYVLREDLVDRGLTDEALIDGLQFIPRAELPGLFETHGQVWHW